MERKVEKGKKNIHKYEDIICLPHPVSSVHPQMPMRERAAQFTPFAALAGHGDAIRETARLTGERVEPDEDWQEILDGKLREVQGRLSQRPAVSVTYFIRDRKKAGGAYVTVTGIVKKFDSGRRFLVMEDGMQITLEDIAEIEIVQ